MCKRREILIRSMDCRSLILLLVCLILIAFRIREIFYGMNWLRGVEQ
jgi:hypothetical protein